MADQEDRLPDNVPGPYFVDAGCIDCDLCRQDHPDFFARSDDGYSFVQRQPETDEEKQAFVEAMEACPVEAIGCID